MDLGATVCLARIPRCDACPLAGECPSRGIRDEPKRKQGRSRDRSANAGRSCCGASPAAGVASADLDPEAVVSLAKDGLVVVLADGRVSLP